MEPLGTPANKESKKSHPIAILIVVGWFVVCVIIFWWFEYRHWQAYPSKLIQFESHALQPLYSILNKEPHDDYFMVHFSNKNCPCESYREAHVGRLASQLKEIKQVTLDVNDLNDVNVSIPATPAVAIWAEGGKLAYFGPYSSGMTCGSGFDFILMTLEKLKSGDNPNWVNTQGYGCFCALLEG